MSVSSNVVTPLLIVFHSPQYLADGINTTLNQRYSLFTRVLICMRNGLGVWSCHVSPDGLASIILHTDKVKLTYVWGRPHLTGINMDA